MRSETIHVIRVESLEGSRYWLILNHYGETIVRGGASTTKATLLGIAHKHMDITNVINYKGAMQRGPLAMMAADLKRCAETEKCLKAEFGNDAVGELSNRMIEALDPDLRDLRCDLIQSAPDHEKDFIGYEEAAHELCNRIGGSRNLKPYATGLVIQRDKKEGVSSNPGVVE